LKTLRPTLVLAAWLACATAQADFNAGLQALARRDFAAAKDAFKPLAEQGDAAAQINLGNLYMKGLGVEQSYPLALRWYQKAAEQGERIAQSKLGILYYHGLGTAANPAEAAHWFRKAADQGVAGAQTVLGSLYAAGEGVPKDLAQAYYWYTMAEEQGNPEAGKGRKSLEDEMTPGEKDEARRLMAETRKRRTEEDEKAFAAATAGLGAPPAAEPKAAVGPGKKTATPGTPKKAAKPGPPVPAP
jgi:hypothetical protein